MPLREDLVDLIEHDNALAQKLLHDLAGHLPHSADAWLLVAQAHDRRLEFDQSLAAYRYVLTLDPKHAYALGGVAFALLSLGQDQAALAAYGQAAAITSNAHHLRMVGLLQHRLGQLNDAITTYERLLSGVKPTSPEINPSLQDLARTLRDADRPLAADQHMRHLISRFQAAPETVASGLVMFNTGTDRHEWSHYADKGVLAEVLTRRQAVDPHGARAPESFVLPRDREALAAFAASDRAPSLYIVKPIRSSGGQGIELVTQVGEALDRQDVVVQRYIDRPYLVEGRKGHARIYGLIASVSPLRAYVYSEGLVRFAPTPYDASPENAGDVSRHITNTALHTGHPDLIISQDPSQEDQGVIWTLSALLRRITADGGDGDQTFAEISQLVAWFVRQLRAEGLFARQAAASPPRAFSPKLFGLDVLVDADGHPWLIEMQRAPAARGAPLVERVNGELFCDVFRMSHGPLIEDGMPPDEIARLVSDPQARLEREAQIEAAQRGRFIALDLGAEV
ncbi:hypothetical protein [Phenylobacterium aquaticum]|uniref:hypothetical protein n=1 Tax=Phenylobacterium aquaticum TaxID=1763816 RepID=UPI0026EC39EA|nr:hypothetical protein [Phenylobacterium aquaticum]